jgi:hypothetical protein
MQCKRLEKTNRRNLEMLGAVADDAERAIMRSDAIEVEVWLALWPLGAPHNIQARKKRSRVDSSPRYFSLINFNVTAHRRSTSMAL